MIIVVLFMLACWANPSMAFFTAQQAAVAGLTSDQSSRPSAQASCPASRCFGGDVFVRAAAHGADDIDLERAMENARANLKEGRSPGAGLESAFDQADAAFADLIVTSIDDQGITLEDEDMAELAKGGMMDDESRGQKSRGLFGDVSDVFKALSGGAHIVRREDGTL